MKKKKDIKITSEMFENINNNLIEKSKKIEIDSEFLFKTMSEMDHYKYSYEQKFEKLHFWEKKLDDRAEKFSRLENEFANMSKNKEYIKVKDELVPSVTTDEDEDICLTGYNVLTPRSNESNFWL